MNFDNYVGYFTETENFDEGFGGDYNCFAVTSNSTSSIYTEMFSVRFRMNSARKGLFVVNLGSDDGSRLSVDGTSVYNNWADQSVPWPRVWSDSPTGSSVLTYEFMENTINNRVVFNNIIPVFGNNLNSNLSQTICRGHRRYYIRGCIWNLPQELVYPARDINGAMTYVLRVVHGQILPEQPPQLILRILRRRHLMFPVPIISIAKQKLSSANNTGVNPYVATNESNAATIIVTAAPSATISLYGGPFLSNRHGFGHKNRYSRRSLFFNCRVINKYLFRGYQFISQYTWNLRCNLYNSRFRHLCYLYNNRKCGN